MSKTTTQNMISVLALYFIALWPFLNFVDHNWQVLTGRVLVYGHILFAFCLLSSAVLSFVIRKVVFSRWCFVFAVFVPILFLYQPIFGVFDGLFPSYTGYEYEGSMRYKINSAANWSYSILACLLLFLAGWCSKSKDRHVIVIMMGIALVSLPMVGIGAKLLKGDQYTLAQQTLPFTVEKEFKHKPNIYLLALDGYPRADVLEDVFAYENDAMMSVLNDVGFKVQKNAITNYPNTHLSLASTVMADYLDMEGDPLFSAEWSARIVGHNAVVQALRHQGYRYIHMEAGVYALTKCLGYEDICIASAQNTISEHEYTLLQSTPWAYLKKIMPIDVYMTDPGASLKQLQDFLKIQKESDRPFFLFAHTVPPHAPYAYNSDCTVKDAFDHGYAEALFGTDKEFFDGYFDNIQCADKMVADFVSYIAENDPEGIVILFSDHGSHFTMDWRKKPWTPRQITERYGVLNAVRAPQNCQDTLYDGMSNVNIMRFVFGCLTETPPVYLEDKQFFSSYVPDTPFYGEIVPLVALRDGKAED